MVALRGTGPKTWQLRSVHCACRHLPPTPASPAASPFGWSPEPGLLRPPTLTGPPGQRPELGLLRPPTLTGTPSPGQRPAILRLLSPPRALLLSLWILDYLVPGVNGAWEALRHPSSVIRHPSLGLYATPSVAFSPRCPRSPPGTLGSSLPLPSPWKTSSTSRSGGVPGHPRPLTAPRAHASKPLAASEPSEGRVVCTSARGVDPHAGARRCPLSEKHVVG